jgi:hypothetical protein
LGSHSNVLGLRRVPLGQRAILAFALGFGIGIGVGICLISFLTGLTGLTGLLGLGTHSFVNLFLTIPSGHLFNLTGLTLSFLLLLELLFVFNFDLDFIDCFLGDCI